MNSPTRKLIDAFNEAWVLDGVMLVTVAVRPDMSARLRGAIERRAMASLTGHCDCGAVAAEAVPVAPRQARAEMAHQSDCDASDARLGPMLRRYYGSHRR